MKKITGAIALVAVIAILISSCKTKEKCPAYGKTEKTQKQNKI